MITLRLPGAVRPAAMFAVQKVIERHRDPGGEPVEVIVGERKITLGYEYNVSGSEACMKDLMAVLDFYAPE